MASAAPEPAPRTGATAQPARPASDAPRSPDKPETDPEPESPYLDALGTYADLAPGALKLLTELAAAPADGSGPAVDVKQVLLYLRKACDNARIALAQPGNAALVEFKFVDATAKVALARSALTRALTPYAGDEAASRETQRRFDGMRATLAKLQQTLAAAQRRP